jgi:hypothetical protein
MPIVILPDGFSRSETDGYSSCLNMHGTTFDRMWKPSDGQVRWRELIFRQDFFSPRRS